MQDEMERRKDELSTTKEIIKKLEEQLKENQVAKEEMVQKQAQLQEMIRMVEESKNHEAKERARLEKEIHSKKNEVDKIKR